MSITDKRGRTYRVERRGPIWYAWDGDRPVIRAVLAGETISEVVVYPKEDRRCGIASALYAQIERDAGITLKPARVRTRAGKAFWKALAQSIPVTPTPGHVRIASDG